MRQILGRLQIIYVIESISYKTLIVRIVKDAKIHLRINFKWIYYVFPILQEQVAYVVDIANITSTNGITQIPPD